MQINIRYQEVRVRRKFSQTLEGEDKFTGSKTYSVVGTLNHERVRLSLGATEKNVAVRRITKIEKAVGEGPNSGLWVELAETLPEKTFAFFADRIGYVQHSPTKSVFTWQDLVDGYEIDMQRRIDNKARGAGREEGILADSTRDRYRATIRQFGAFLGNNLTPLVQITPALITKFKIQRQKDITALKQSRGGTSIALDIAVLHAMFAFAVEQKMISEKPIDLSKESKPGKNPKNGARPFTGTELSKIREVVVFKQKGQPLIDDTHCFLILRWLGLRTSDAVNLRWEHVHFDRGVNGEVEILTQKRSKVAIIPLSSELRDLLEDLYKVRNPRSDDRVLWNPDTKQPFTSRVRLSVRMKALCARAAVKGSAHCFRDTFVADMLARGVSIYDVAQMVADTVETIEKHYAQFVPAARDAAQRKMDTGVGIEEQAKIASQRGKKVVGIRG